MLRKLIPRLLAVLILSSLAFPSEASGLRFSATAHSRKGKTANGTTSRRGTVAADPNILPLGSVIRVRGAGRYSGDYTVVDDGSRVKGQHIDIYMPSAHEAKQFGRRQVEVEIIANPPSHRR